MGQKVNATQQSSELGYAEITVGNGSFVGSSTPNDIPSLTVTVNVPSGATIIIEGIISQVYSSVAGDRADFTIRESSTVINTSYNRVDGSSSGWGGARVFRRIQPSAGSHTYKLSIARGAGTGANYSSRLSANGGADSQPINQNQNYIDAVGSATQVMWGTYDILNIANQEKVSIGQTTSNPTGTGVTPNRREQVQKWVNTSAQITSLLMDAFSGANTFAVGSEIIVYGHD